MSCNETDITPQSCDEHAIVEDWSDLDGCGYLFKLDNGGYLEPLMVFYCGTPPVPEEQLSNPLTDFDLYHGQEVMISYELLDDYGSICMKGTVAQITCIEEFEPIIGD